MWPNVSVRPGKCFTWRSSSEYHHLAYRVPQSRKLPKQELISMPLVREVALMLGDYASTGRISVDPQAAREISRLCSEHNQHRIKIRQSHRKYKKNAVKDIKFNVATKPMHQQLLAAAFCLTHSGSFLLMEQGTGKTLSSLLVVLRRIEISLVRRVLVWGPLSVIPVWFREFEKHCPGKFEVLNFESRDGFSGDKVEVAVLNYDRLFKEKKNLIKWGADVLIADEIHRLRNHTAKWSRAAHKIADGIPVRLGLTGTPIGQCPLDLWSQYRVVSPDVFGRDYKNFEERYAIKGGYMGKQVVSYQNLEELAEKTHSVAFRCTKKECLDLPPERNILMHCELDGESKRIYADLMRDMETVIDEDTVTVDLVVSRLMKLRQLTGGLIKTDGGKLRQVSRAKLNTAIRFIENRSWEKKLVIFCTFIHEIEMLQSCLEAKGYSTLILRGSTRKSERSDIQKRFQDPDDESQIFISQVGVGAEGIDLYAANEDLFYSPTFSFIQYHQAKARIHRIGQEHSVKHRHLVMSNTVDSKIMQFLFQHGDLTKMILDDLRDYRV